ncbi:MAG: FixH family protein [Flavobacteriaceae bacterium]|jgi:hypothetical protein|nr:FixH family protein [Flavobacteriaceae bacterium]
MKKPNNKFFHILLFSFITILFTASCGNDDNNEIITPDNETSGLAKIQEISDDSYTILFYSKSGNLTVGYNEIYLQVKNKSTGEWEKNASLSWQPIMQMTDKSHSCPFGSLEKVSGKQTLYKGFVIFTMASSETDIWKLAVNYNIGSKNGKIEPNLDVLAVKRKNLQNFTGDDNTKYVLALAEPASPSVGSNDMIACLYKMQDMNTFIPVENYTIKIDPRMPDMNNHTSSNNVDLTSSGSGIYRGKANFTMTGYWKINLIVYDSNHQIIKGEEVTDTHLASSVFFELEF